MPGTKSSGRPGGNPELKKYWFQTERSEPLRARVQIRITETMKKELQEKEDWQEFVRVAIAKALQEEEENLKSA